MCRHLKQRANSYYFDVFYENNRFSIFVANITQSQCTNHLKINACENVWDALGGKKQIMHLLIHYTEAYFTTFKVCFLSALSTNSLWDSGWILLTPSRWHCRKQEHVRLRDLTFTLMECLQYVQTPRTPTWDFKSHALSIYTPGCFCKSFFFKKQKCFSIATESPPCQALQCADSSVIVGKGLRPVLEL